MAKRNREEESSFWGSRQARCVNPAKPPPPKCCRISSVGGGAMGKGERETSGREEQVAGGSLSAQGVVAGDAMKPRGLCGGGGSAAAAAVELPRWWQLWLGRGGGTVVDCEELLWGWFPFVDEDFACGGKKVEWASSWGDEGEGPQQDVFYDDIWQLKHIYQIPSHSR